MEFRIGDKVRIKANCKNYGITLPGSEGIIIKILDSSPVRYLINFYKLTCPGSDKYTKTYDIYEDNLELVGPKKKLTFKDFNL